MSALSRPIRRKNVYLRSTAGETMGETGWTRAIEVHADFEQQATELLGPVSYQADIGDDP